MARARYGGQLVSTTWEDFENWLEPLDHLTKAYELTGPLENILQMAFRDTQRRVSSPAHPHVPTYAPTGRLFRSGRVSSGYRNHQWHGDITYGDASTKVVWRGGVGNYAVYEQQRGDIHNYFSGLDQYHQMYLDAIEGFFKFRRAKAAAAARRAT